MPVRLIDFDWFGLLQLLAWWLLAVMAGLWVMDWLFPRLRRSDEPAPAPPDPLPWYPPPPRLPQRAAAAEAPAVDPAYWRANVRTIGVLLLIWAAISFGSAALAPALNAFRVLTGFPLGYYMGAQGSLVVFLGLVTAYIWRAGRLDQRFRAATAAVPVIERIPVLRTGLLGGLFVGGFVLFAVVMSALERQFQLSATMLGWALFILTLGIYAVIGVAARTRSLDEYFVAGRRIPAFFNGLATAGDWMSAASFISMAGTLWLLGYEGLAYIMGWTGGYVVLAMLLAPYLRKFGQFTIPDFVAARYDGNLARAVAAFIGIVISFTYVTAQVTGVGIIMSRFLGVNYLAGVVIGLGAVLFCSYLGGMRAITWTQVIQGLILLTAYLVPVTLLSYRATGVPIPQLMYGQALQQIAELEAAAGIAQSYVTPYNDWTPWNFFALMLCLMLGTCGLPHILVRFYTVPDPQSARQSVGWALGFILLLYFTAPAYAAFSRLEVLKNVVGRPTVALPEWASNWARAGLLTLEDTSGDGLLQFDELQISPDLVVLATPEIAGLPETIAALVAAGGLSAALSTADGLLLVIASALSHDVYARMINPRASAEARLLLGRIAVFASAIAAAVVATRRLAIIAQIVAWAFSLAAATFFPILVLGIFWKRANGRGAVAGMLAGLLVTVTYMLLNVSNPALNILGITHEAAGVFGLPVNFLVTILVSRLTPPPSAAAQALVDQLRQP